MDRLCSHRRAAAAFARGRALLIAASALSLAACASYAGRGLEPGAATRDEVIAVMGAPALRWKDAGGEQLAYPRGPAGYHTFMVFLDPDGRLIKIENVLDEPHFAGLAPGSTDRAGVLRQFGPPLLSTYFKSRDEEVWEYRYCDLWNYPARFGVLIDGRSGIVRSAIAWREPDGRFRTFCSR